MNRLTPRELLARHGLRPKKSWGQNFLANGELASRMAEFATTPRAGTVVEIGAGLGALTVPLLGRAERVIAIERDRDLAGVLREELEEPLASGRLVLLEADAKETDYLGLLASGPRPHVVAGNLPYQLTGVLLERIAGLAGALDRAIVLVQAEVAQRITAGPSDAGYGGLSVFLQAQYRPRRAMQVRSGAFYPQPSVDSALVILEPLRPAITEESPTFRTLVSSAFGQRRKQLRNAWSSILGPRELEQAAERAGIDLGARGETLGVGAFARMAREVSR